jgi:DHA2 family multidrug resistance protein
LLQSSDTADAARATLERIIEPQAAMLATNQVMLVTACVMAVAALSIWLAPRPAHAVDTSHVH